MANEKHLKVLNRGAKEWNQWREKEFHGIPDLKGADLGERELNGIDFNHTMLQGASFFKSDLKKANFSAAGLAGATFDEADLEEADFKGAFLTSRTSFQNANVPGAIFERYQLEQLDNYGGLTTGQRMDLEILDDVAKLRLTYSGFQQWVHLIALGVFLFPYVWFVIAQWSRTSFILAAKANFPDADFYMPLWKAIALFIYNGGVDWQIGPKLHWSFWVFLFMLFYNFLRAALLWKTKQLENYQTSTGLRAKFSFQKNYWMPLVDDSLIGKYAFLFRLRKLMKWGFVYQLSKWGFFIAIVVAFINTYYFFTQVIPIY